MVRIWIEDWGKMKHEMRQRWTTSTKPSHPIQKTRHATNVKRPRGIVDFCFLLSNLKSLLTRSHDLIIFFETLLEYTLWYFCGVELKISHVTILVSKYYINHLKYDLVDNWTHSSSLTLTTCCWEFCCLDKFGFFQQIQRHKVSSFCRWDVVC